MVLTAAATAQARLFDPYVATTASRIPPVGYRQSEMQIRLSVLGAIMRRGPMGSRIQQAIGTFSRRRGPATATGLGLIPASVQPHRRATGTCACAVSRRRRHQVLAVLAVILLLLVQVGSDGS